MTIKVGDEIAVMFEGKIAAIERSKTGGVWFVVANAIEGVGVLRLAMTDGELMQKDPKSVVELVGDDDGEAEPSTD